MRIDLVASQPLAANAVFTSDWFSNPLSGAPGAGAGQSVRVTSYSDQPGRIAIQQCDDSGMSNLLAIVSQTGTSGGVPAQLQVAVSSQSWRVIYTNGATAQTTFQMLAASTSDLTPAILAELQRINRQLTAMRSSYDNGLDEGY